MGVGVIRWIGGPVLKARSTDPFRVHEAVWVGPRRLLGEVVRLEGDELTVQVFEETTGLRPGDPVEGQGTALAVRLGPHLLGGIFDGLLRSLDDCAADFLQTGGWPRQTRRFPFTPLVQEGAALEPGQPFGEAITHPQAARPHLCLVPPGLSGEATRMVEAGTYGDDEPLCQIKDRQGRLHDLAMSHFWPVRTPRPAAERLPIGPPMITGQRIIDCLIPVAQGGKTAVPGGFGTGKTVLLETVAKWCNADIIVYVGCGERGNEMSGLLDEFPRLEDPRTGRPLMERTVVIANTSNMPVAAREASIYTGVTVAEYFRDQGLHVAVMADSTSRWAEALREVSGRLGELPGEAGYPAYLSTRLAEFYERAARVRPLGGGEGSVTLIGAVSPPSSDFSEPVTVHTKRYVRNFWALDKKRAYARFYPAIDPLLSYSEDAADLAPWWQRQGATRWGEQRKRFLTLLEEQAKIERMARILGKDSLPPRQRLTLLTAGLVNESFLRQSAFAPKDRYASPERQNRMMTLLERFIALSEGTLQAGIDVERIAALPVLRRLMRMGEEIGEDELPLFAELERDLEAAFHALAPMGTLEDQP